MATGVLPFRGESSAATLDAILHKAHTAPVRINPDLPDELERIINRALEKDPHLRYQSASDIRADLQRLKRDSASRPEAAGAPLPIAAGKPTKWRLIVPAVAVFAALALGVGLNPGGLRDRLYRRKRHPAHRVAGCIAARKPVRRSEPGSIHQWDDGSADYRIVQNQGA